MIQQFVSTAGFAGPRRMIPQVASTAGVTRHQRRAHRNSPTTCINRCRRCIHNLVAAAGFAGPQRKFHQLDSTAGFAGPRRNTHLFIMGGYAGQRGRIHQFVSTAGFAGTRRWINIFFPTVGYTKLRGYKPYKIMSKGEEISLLKRDPRLTSFDLNFLIQIRLIPCLNLLSHIGSKKKKAMEVNIVELKGKGRRTSENHTKVGFLGHGDVWRDEGKPPVLELAPARPPIPPKLGLPSLVNSTARFRVIVC